MAKPIKGKDGKFQGSVGDGIAKVPTAAPTASSKATTQTGTATQSTSRAASYAETYRNFHRLTGQKAEQRQIERALGDNTIRKGDVVVVNGDADGQATSFRYKVVKRTPKTVTLRMIRMNGTLGDPETLRVQDPGGREYLKMHGGYKYGVPEAP